MARSVLVLVIVTSCAAEQPPPPEPPPPISDPFPSERGFVDVAGRHMFYALFSADADPARAPLFVLFNGGPGFPTTLGLLPCGTGPFVVDELGAAVGNDASFTRLASLLYLDQPATGFSYDDASLGSIPFDATTDAGAFASAIQGVLDTHSIFAASELVLVGESYGGTRAQLVIDRLGDRVGAQVLIEPVVMGSLQTNESHPAPGACTYDTSQTDRCVVGAAPGVLADAEAGTRLLGGALEDIPGLRGPDRHGAARTGFDDAEPALEARLGPLDPGDAYFAGGPFNPVDFDQIIPVFESNLARVPTFITHAMFDGIVDSTAIGRALADAGLGATFDAAAPAGAARPGEWTVHLASGAVTIRMPTYDAGHMVAQRAGKALRDDIAAWLTAGSRTRTDSEP
jgi:pimeloyl-ACP methyl ester carboxylesterase